MRACRTTATALWILVTDWSRKDRYRLEDRGLEGIPGAVGWTLTCADALDGRGGRVLARVQVPPPTPKSAANVQVRWGGWPGEVSFGHGLVSEVVHTLELNVDSDALRDRNRYGTGLMATACVRWTGGYEPSISPPTSAAELGPVGRSGGADVSSAHRGIPRRRSSRRPPADHRTHVDEPGPSAPLVGPFFNGVSAERVHQIGCTACAPNRHRSGMFECADRGRAFWGAAVDPGVTP